MQKQQFWKQAKFGSQPKRRVRCRLCCKILNSESPENQGWFNKVPRVKFRSAKDRATEQLKELAILNEKLAGQQPWEIRNKIDGFKGKRKNWGKIYDYLIANEFQATLEEIMQASRKVEAALDDQVLDTTSVQEQEDRLLEFQRELRSVYERLRVLEARVDMNIERVGDLKLEAEMLEQAADDNMKLEMKLRRQFPVFSSTVEDRDIAGDNPQIEQVQDLQECWYPVSFSSKLTQETLIPFDLFNYPWVVFRGSDGQVGCIKDECAHRACPLSLGKIIDGEIQCPYHGFQFTNQGDCTKMPSTRFVPGLRVPNGQSVERDGFVWVKPKQYSDASQISTGLHEPPNALGVPGDLTVRAEVEMMVDVDQGLLTQHLLELAHAPLTLTPVFTKGIDILNFVSRQAYTLMLGKCNPTPVDIVYEPPCTLIQTFQYVNSGQLVHQVHVCLPAMEGKTRVLYRVASESSGGLWEDAWQRVATESLHDDLMFVQWQRGRLFKMQQKNK